MIGGTNSKEFFLLKHEGSHFVRVFPSRDDNVALKAIFGLVLEEILLGKRLDQLEKIYEIVNLARSDEYSLSYKLSELRTETFDRYLYM